MSQCEYALKQGDAEYREALENVKAQCIRMMSMIQQLMQVSRTINTANTLEKEEFNISMLCESVCDEMSSLASEKGVKIKTDVQPAVSYRGDETLIMRMLINLVSNAVKYRDANEDREAFVKITLKKEETDAEEAYLLIKVIDNGIGISEEDTERIFDRFYKVDKSRSDEDSFGLGLSMVKWIAEAHGGSVDVESVPGEGSTFTVRLF